MRTFPVESASMDARGAVFGDATVLVVDDRPPNLDLLRRVLTKAGVRDVHTTTDPAAVVHLYQQLRPDLVLLDLHMPGMDGVAVMRAIADATPHDEFVPVIVLTADATSEARDRVLAAGANDFLTKPIDRTEVILRARNLLQTRALHSRLKHHNGQLQAEVAERRLAEARAQAAAHEKSLRVQSALDVGAPRMVFQPIVDLASGRIVGCEALARFDLEPRRPPNEWFEDATEIGRGTELELAAVQHALGELHSVPPGLSLSVNVSPNTAMSADLHALLADRPHRQLVLEITEHSRVDDYDLLLGALANLRDSGVRLAVDDAGSGYASLQHILRLRPDIIKLDITLTRGIDDDPIKRALASSLVTFSREMGSTIIAEGIETNTELVALIELGVPLGQGYHLGRPTDLNGALAPI